MDRVAEARAERTELADLLSELTPEQWEQPSLCAGWRIRDVVAHMISYDDLGPAGLVTTFVRGGLRPDRVNALGVRAATGLSAPALLERFRRHLEPAGLTRGFGGAIGLVDGMIHQQDIRRPLQRPRAIPAARLAFALGFAGRAPTLPSRRAVRGLRLRADDVDFTAGDGPEVTGPGEALLLAIAGRPAALADLSGDGVPLLRHRLG